MRNRIKIKYLASVFFIILFDLLVFYFSLYLSYSVRIVLGKYYPNIFPVNIFPFTHFLSFWWLPLIFVGFIGYERLYMRRLFFWNEVHDIIKAVFLAIIVILAIVSLGKLSDEMSRFIIVILGVELVLFLPIERLWVKKILYRMFLWKEGVLIIGDNSKAILVAEAILRNEKYMGYYILGFLGENIERKSVKIRGKEYPILGSVKDILETISKYKMDSVVIALSPSDYDIEKIVNSIYGYVKEVYIVPDIKGVSLLNADLYFFFMEQIFLLRIKSNLLNLSHKFLKRLFDIIFSLLLIPFFLPIMIIIGILIKLDSRGPIFFIQERIGIFGKKFRVFKFRTMYLDADFRLDAYLKDNPSAREEWDKYKKLRGFDPRVTRVGKIIRQLSLDELPQIFNVLLGDMSFVGPRPYLEGELKRYEDYAKIILMIPPGITGLWQTSGRNELSFEERLRLDTWYVLNWTLWLDIVILLKTIKVILTREGAY